MTTKTTIMMTRKKKPNTKNIVGVVSIAATVTVKITIIVIADRREEKTTAITI